MTTAVILIVLTFSHLNFYILLFDFKSCNRILFNLLLPPYIFKILKKYEFTKANEVGIRNKFISINLIICNYKAKTSILFCTVTTTCNIFRGMSFEWQNHLILFIYSIVKFNLHIRKTTYIWKLINIILYNKYNYFSFNVNGSLEIID